MQQCHFHTFASINHVYMLACYRTDLEKTSQNHLFPQLSWSLTFSYVVMKFKNKTTVLTALRLTIRRAVTTLAISRSIRWLPIATITLLSIWLASLLRITLCGWSWVGPITSGKEEIKISQVRNLFPQWTFRLYFCFSLCI